MNNSEAAGASRDDIYIAHQIKNALIVQGTNQTALAAKTGIKYTTLRRSLDQAREDRRSLTVNEIGRIAEALNIPPAILVPEKFSRQVAA
jgi:lambda repressor-like predicted transcriptional regulator